jgi:hypothetical protein
MNDKKFGKFSDFVRFLFGFLPITCRYNVQAKKIAFFRTVKMKKNNRIYEPLCKFGPGGEYSYYWPEHQPQIDRKNNPILRLLASINYIVNATLTDQQQADYASKSMKNYYTAAKKERNERILPPDNYTKANPCTENDSRIQPQTWLFPDYGRDCSGASFKPKHHIRTYRRTAKKGASFRLNSQRTLFETDKQSHKTA